MMVGMPDSFTTTTTVDVTLAPETDPEKLSRPVADVIASECAAGIRAISEMSRDKTHRLFNKTGHLASGLRVEAHGDAFAIVTPADRALTDDQMERLGELVPVIADPFTSPKVNAAVQEQWERVVGKR